MAKMINLRCVSTNQTDTFFLFLRWCSQSTEMLLLIGGVSRESEHNHWAFDPVTSQWYTVSPLQSPRHLFGVAQCGGGLYVFGGLTKNMTEDKFLTTVELYDAKLNKWKSVKKTMREGIQTLLKNNICFQ